MVGGSKAVDEMIELERAMLQGDKTAAIIGRGLSHGATQAKPLANLTHALGGSVGEMILDPIQSAIIKAPRIQRAINQQAVRNSMGEMIDVAIAKGDDYGKYLERTVHRSNDPKLINAIIQGQVGSWVRALRGETYAG